LQQRLRREGRADADVGRRWPALGGGGHRCREEVAIVGRREEVAAVGMRWTPAPGGAVRRREEPSGVGRRRRPASVGGGRRREAAVGVGRRRLCSMRRQFSGEREKRELLIWGKVRGRV
jgi:hypothetical protein